MKVLAVLCAVCLGSVTYVSSQPQPVLAARAAANAVAQAQALQALQPGPLAALLQPGGPGPQAGPKGGPGPLIGGPAPAGPAAGAGPAAAGPLPAAGMGMMPYVNPMGKGRPMIHGMTPNYVADIMGGRPGPVPMDIAHEAAALRIIGYTPDQISDVLGDKLQARFGNPLAAAAQMQFIKAMGGAEAAGIASANARPRVH